MVTIKAEIVDRHFLNGQKTGTSTPVVILNFISHDYAQVLHEDGSITTVPRPDLRVLNPEAYFA